MTDQQLQNWVEQLSIEHFKKPFRHEARFNSRLRTTGGRYLLGTHAIEINPGYVTAATLSQAEGIIKHELCHYHLHIGGKGYQHRDQDFKQLLKQVDAPRFCQALPGVKRRQALQLHYYQCSKCRLLYSRKIRMNTDKYRCGKCSGALIYQGLKKQ